MKSQYIKALYSLWRKEAKFSYACMCYRAPKVGVNLELVKNSDEKDLLTALNTNSILGGSSGKTRTPSPSCPYYFAGTVKHQSIQNNEPLLLF